jgi:Ca2+-binding RTX toxin-like protein
MATVHGSEASETINGYDGVTHSSDIIYGYGGVDWIFGRGGNDEIYGGEGGDWIFGEGDNDVLKGGGGADHLNGGTGTDWVSYADAPTGIEANLTNESGGYGRIGIAQDDRFYSIENLSGSAYDDFLWGNDSTNTLAGQGGDDYMYGNGGADILDGGTGWDTATYTRAAATEGVYISLITGLGFGGDAEGDRLFSIEEVSGSIYDDVLVGNDGPNHFWGSSGHDSLKGGGGVDTLMDNSGNDLLDGGSGADQMAGGIDDDTYIVDHRWDGVDERAGEGSDTVRASVSYVLPAGEDVEFLTTTDDNGTSAITLTGNETGNVVRGNNGNNTINGGDGRDELIGLGGQDWFLFNTELDDETIVDPDTNVDIITGFNVVDDTIRLDATIFSSSLVPDNSVAGSQFFVGAAAGDANHRIIYNNTTGAVLYDSDGTGPTPHIQFATLSAGLADPTDLDPLTNFDFFVVA